MTFDGLRASINQIHAQDECLKGILSAFAAKGVKNATLEDLRNREHPLQRFSIAVRNSKEDRKGGYVESAFELMKCHYDFLGDCPAPSTSFLYKVFDREHDSAWDVMEFVDAFDNVDEILTTLVKLHIQRN